jgi:hypothetical protein
MTCRLLLLFALEPVVPRGHESHGREAQGKSQENAADENSDDHGITSFSFREIMMLWLIMVLKINLARPSHPNISFSPPGFGPGASSLL